MSIDYYNIAKDYIDNNAIGFDGASYTSLENLLRRVSNEAMAVQRDKGINALINSVANELPNPHSDEFYEGFKEGVRRSIAAIRKGEA